MLKLYGFSGSRSNRSVWMLEEVKAEYEYINLDILSGEANKPSYLKLNPAGKVPTLVDGDLILSESAAIGNYLADTFPQAGLIPKAGTPERALHDMWCFFVIGELEQPLWTLAKHDFILPENLRVPAIIETAKHEFSDALNVLNIGLGDKEYIMGDKFTAVDILIAHTLGWAKFAQCSLDHKTLEDYAERVLARPALAMAKQREEQGSEKH